MLVINKCSLEKLYKFTLTVDTSYIYRGGGGVGAFTKRCLSFILRRFFTGHGTIKEKLCLKVGIHQGRAY
jgi:hypothetical protein